MTIERELKAQVVKRIKPQKVMLIYGPRRVGKTLLLREIFNEFEGKKLLLNGESSDTVRMLSDRSISNYKHLFADVSLLAIDEAQHIPEIGMKLKLMVDEIPGLAIVATGSSSFDLQNQAGEPLVGRSTRFMLTPFSIKEINKQQPTFQTITNIDQYLVYGFYPELISIDSGAEQARYLTEIVDSYLLRDILAIDGVKNAQKMHDLLRLVAYQVGSEVSTDELGKQLGVSRNTAERYLDLLQKVFVLYRLGGYSKNLRKEVVKSSKWYFQDNGIRNAVLNDFRPFADRSSEERGALWENFIIGERMKRKHNNLSNINLYFWRTYDQQEIDLIEEDGEIITAYEIKSGKKNPKIPKAFANAYPEAAYNIVNKDVFWNYVE
ncbi:MAG: ATP-binding protein [Paludibacteraceae bacterium]|jgi:predicted AAA+ superfamily ATPase|nr:ATP-binding protein [Paludibacteraceae bacterium]